MIPYLITFFISISSFAFSSKNKEKLIKIIFTIIGITSLCVLAGIRSSSIGTDTSGYLFPLINGALTSNSYKEFSEYSWYIHGYIYRITSDFEFGFTLYIYLISKVFNSTFWVLFFIELLITLPIYFSIKKFVGEKYLWLSFVVYCLLFYNLSFNMIRQCIAMGFVMLAISNLNSNKKIIAIVYILIGMLFHLSSIVGLGIVVIYLLINSNKVSLSSKIKTFFLIFIGILLLVFSNFFVDLLNLIGLGKYSGYIDGNVHLMINQIIAYSPILFFSILLFKNNSNKKYAFLFVCFIYALILLQFTSVNSFGGRIAYYFLYLLLFFIPYLNGIIKNRNYKLLFNIIIIAYCCFYWWFFYAYGGIGETVPFVIR